MRTIPFSSCLAGVCLVAILSMIIPAQGADAPDEEGEVVTGVLTEFDRTDMRATIQTDVERGVHVKVIKPELFQRLSIGQRISVRINSRGEAVKVMEAPLPDLHKPIN